MSSILTFEEYQSIAGHLVFPTTPFIDGRFGVSTRPPTFETINPGDGSTLAHISVCGEAEVDLAVSKARQSFEDRRWAGLHPMERKVILIKLGKLIQRDRHQLAVLESLESGKPIAEIETIDIPEMIHCIAWHAEMIDKLYDQVAPSGEETVALIVREPVGVVAAVLPWNFPMLMMAWKLAPALGAGNSVVIKPAEETSMTALRIAELAVEAGVPGGVFNVVTGPGEITGKWIGLHPDIDMVSFTGSTETGKAFLKYAADSNLKKVVLECGGKNPCVVMKAAEDLDIVAQHVTNGVFWNMGENCSSNSRLIVDQSLCDELIEKICYRLSQWRTGYPLDPANRLGAIVSEKQHQQILDHIRMAKTEGAKLIAGGETINIGKGYYITPTVFSHVTSDMTLAREEVFGPVLAIMTASGEDQAINMANDTCYGLTASVFTSDLRQAHRMAKSIRAGTVTVNCFGEGDITTPFGGYKQSGFGGRDNSIHAHDQYTELKTIWIDISDQRIADSIG